MGMKPGDVTSRIVEDFDGSNKKCGCKKKKKRRSVALILKDFGEPFIKWL